MGNLNTIYGQPLVFGDPKQIAFVQKTERRFNEMIDGGIEISEKEFTIKVQVTLSFSCFQCGNPLEIEVNGEISPMEEVGGILEDETVTCSSCQCEYLNDYGTLCLIGNPQRPDKVTEIKEDSI